jgi:trimethylamine:corrinoid methyltransferase-like protein
LDIFERAKLRVNEILADYQPPELPAAQVAELKGMVERLARDAGMDELPKLDLI